MRVRLADDRVLEADEVVAGLGIEPNVELAAAAGIAVDGGIVVDEYGRVDGAKGCSRRAMSRVSGAGARRAGAGRARGSCEHARSRRGRERGRGREPYDHLPFFYSDLFDFGYEAVGAVDARAATRAHWTEPGKKGVFAYVDDAGRPRGFLLWGIFGRVDAARGLIRAGAPIDEDALAKLAG